MSKATFFVILFLAVFLGVFFYETLQEYPKVDIIFVKLAPNYFLDMKIKTRGFVTNPFGYLGKMFELRPIGFSSSEFPVSFSGFDELPSQGDYVEIRGHVTKLICEECGNYYLIQVDSWSYSSTGLEIISDTATLSVVLALLLLLFALGKLVFSVLMHKRLKKALTSKNYGFEYD